MQKIEGIQYLLKALDGFEQPFKVDIVGDGPYLSELIKIRQEITCRDQIRFHGWLENNSLEFQQLFRQASIFVLPSTAENFPVVLLEAMAAGTAIITTRGTGCEEVVGESAVLVEPGDVPGLKQALGCLFSDPERVNQLGHLGRQRLETLFNWEGIANRYLELYQQVGLFQ